MPKTSICLAFFAAFGAWRFLKMISTYLTLPGWRRTQCWTLVAGAGGHQHWRPTDSGRPVLPLLQFLNLLFSLLKSFLRYLFIRLHSTKPNGVLVPGRSGFFRWVLTTTSSRRINRWCLIGRRQGISNQVCRCVIVFQPRKHDMFTD